jgi:hypothetical protein
MESEVEEGGRRASPPSSLGVLRKENQGFFILRGRGEKERAKCYEQMIKKEKSKKKEDDPRFPILLAHATSIH